MAGHRNAMPFDFEAFRRAFTTRDPEAWVDCYAEDAVWIEYRHRNPPRSPHVMDRTMIDAHIRALCDADLSLEIRDEVIGRGRCAFHVVVTLPGGRRILENVIIHLEGDRITKQVDVEASD